MSRSTIVRRLRLLKPAGFARRGGGEGGSGDRMSRGAGAAEEAARDAPEPAERLERIATYARAGYFNMGYTLDMMQVPTEILPD